jgi:uncharacterized protein (TIGR02246 family)
MIDDATQVATALIQELVAAWNAGSGEAFGRPFAEEADFVDIRGEYHQGRAPIAFGHQAILDTIYKDSTAQFELLRARTLAPGLVSAQVAATMQAPSGPLAGENRAVYTLVARYQDHGWQIEVFHNTLVPREMDREERQVRDSIR